MTSRSRSREPVDLLEALRRSLENLAQKGGDYTMETMHRSTCVFSGKSFAETQGQPSNCTCGTAEELD